MRLQAALPMGAASMVTVRTGHNGELQGVVSVGKRMNTVF